MKKSVLMMMAVIIIGGAGYFYYQASREKPSLVPPVVPEKSVVIDPQNATYIIEGETVALVNGSAEEAIATDSAAKKITRYFGNDVKADLNGDGRKDAAFLLTQDGGGSGTFFYAAAVLNNGKKGIGTNAFFIGDRIAPQNTEFKDGMIIVNFAERQTGEPFAAPPTVGVSKYFKIVDGVLTEANPEIDLPLGYTIESFTVEKISTTTCAVNNDCQTPIEYLVQSRCPFVSLCLENKCTVVCPGYKEE